MAALIWAGALGLIANLALLLFLGARIRTAAGLASALFGAANVALVAVVLAALRPELAPAGSLLYALSFAAGFRLLPPWTALARVTFVYLAVAAALYLAHVAWLTFSGGLGPLAVALSALLLLFEVAAFCLTLSYAFETFDVLCRVRRRRVEPPPPDGTAPFVSVHVPTYSEPPELVKETLDSLARLEYPNFEVVVVDNNTTDPDLWRPVEAHCAALGPRFRFVHVDRLDGFKAGACNFALGRTDPRAELIAIVDADYVVEPTFLRECVPHFRDERLGFLQTPQDYREYSGNRFLTDCLHAYAYFFAISMTARNEHGAPIFAGTMGLIRRSVLQEIGGWNERCITEDAEASLRMLKLGHHGLYVAHTYGRGLMPFEFDGYKKQRFRWCFGGVQILRMHWRALVPFAPREPADRLTGAQRAWYLTAGLQWFAEPLQLAFASFLIVGGVGYALGGGLIARPLAEAILIFPVVFLGLGVVRFLWALRVALRLSIGDALGAAVSMLSLSWVVTQAALAALVRREGIFLRTSKVRARTKVGRALHGTRWESAIAAACATAGGVVLASASGAVAAAMAVLCAWQAFVYGSAFANCLSAIRSATADVRPDRYRRRPLAPGLRVAERRTALAAAVALVTFLALGSVASSPVVVDDFGRTSFEDGLVPIETRRVDPTATRSPGPTRSAAPTAAPVRAGPTPSPAPAGAPAPVPSGPPGAAPTTAPSTPPDATPTPESTRTSPPAATTVPMPPATPPVTPPPRP